MKAPLFFAFFPSFFAQAQKGRLVLQNITLVEMEKGRLRPQQTVVMEGKKHGRAKKRSGH